MWFDELRLKECRFLKWTVDKNDVDNVVTDVSFSIKLKFKQSSQSFYNSSISCNDIIACLGSHELQITNIYYKTKNNFFKFKICRYFVYVPRYFSRYLPRGWIIQGKYLLAMFVLIPTWDTGIHNLSQQQNSNCYPNSQIVVSVLIVGSPGV